MASSGELVFRRSVEESIHFSLELYTGYIGNLHHREEVRAFLKAHPKPSLADLKTFIDNIPAGVEYGGQFHTVLKSFLPNTILNGLPRSEHTHDLKVELAKLQEILAKAVQRKDEHKALVASPYFDTLAALGDIYKKLDQAAILASGK